MAPNRGKDSIRERGIHGGRDSQQPPDLGYQKKTVASGRINPVNRQPRRRGTDFHLGRSGRGNASRPFQAPPCESSVRL